MIGIKRILALAACLLIVFAPLTLCYADSQRMYGSVDWADILSDSEEKLLDDRMSEICANRKIDVVIYTDDSSYGKSYMEAADAFYDERIGTEPDRNGVLLFVCMEPGNRGWWTTTTGTMIDLFGYDEINIIDDAIEPYLVDGDYYGAFDKWLDYVDVLVRDGKFTRDNLPAIEDKYEDYWDFERVDEDTEMPEEAKTGIKAGAATVAGAAGALGTAGSMKAKMKTVRRATSAGRYLRKDSFKLRRKNNMLISKTVTRSRIAESSGGGGGGIHHSGHSSFSGGHHSSGGGFHGGGGGRHF